MFLKEKVNLLGVMSVTNVGTEPTSLITLGFEDNLATVPYRHVDLAKENLDDLKEEVLDELLDDGYSLKFSNLSSKRILESKDILVQLLGESGFEKAVKQKQNLYTLASSDSSSVEYKEAYSEVEKSNNW